MRIRILDRAEIDLVEGFHFYENQEPGIGSYFLDCLSSDINSLRLYSGTHPVHFRRHYRLLSRKFPFAIYYRVEQETTWSTPCWTAAVTRRGFDAGCWSSHSWTAAPARNVAASASAAS